MNFMMKFFRTFFIVALAVFVTSAAFTLPSFANATQEKRTTQSTEKKKKVVVKKTAEKKKSSKKKSNRSTNNRATSYDITNSSKYASLTVDEESGRVLSQADAGAARYPASLTKMMTLYLLFDAIRSGKLEMHERLPVSSFAASRPPSNLNLQAGQSIRVRDALMALIIKSANDVAVVVAEAIAGSEQNFSEKMTKTAHALGMEKTYFKNASGLHHPNQITTAYDLAKLAIALHRDFPQYYPFFQRTGFNFRGHYYSTHNRVVSQYAGADGLKTGFTLPSGFNLVTTANRDGKRIVGVVLGGQSAKIRDQHMMHLLDRAFANSAQIRSAADVNFSETNDEKKISLPAPILKPIDALIIRTENSQKIDTESSGDFDPEPTY
jgi:D-alanyl-D-alanine carboxypeptidase